MTATFQHLRTFVHEHDDIPAFHAAFLVSTFLAAAILHLGFFVVLVVLHMCLDYVKYRDFYHLSIPVTIRSVALESISDIALILISLTFAVYLSHDFMLVAVSGLLRSELTLLRAVGTIIPKIRILEHVLAAFADIHAYLHAPAINLKIPLTRVQRISLHAIGGCTLLLTFSVFLYRNSLSHLVIVILRELSIEL